MPSFELDQETVDQIVLAELKTCQAYMEFAEVSYGIYSSDPVEDRRRRDEMVSALDKLIKHYGG